MSYAAAYLGLKPVIRLNGGSSGVTPWVRPTDWPALPVLGEAENKFVGIYGVDATDGNYVSLLTAVSSGTWSVDWGDGTVETGLASNVKRDHWYDYAAIGSTPTAVGGWKTVTVTVTTSGGGITTFSLQQKHSLAGLQTGIRVNWLDVAINAPSMTSLAIGGPTTVVLDKLEKATVGVHNVTSMSNMFQNCYGLQSVPLFSTGAVTSMGSMFAYCYSLQTVPLFSTGAVTSMSSMFYACYSLQSVPLFSTGAVTNMSNMFYACSSLQSVPLFSTGAVTSMSSMFYVCSSLQTVPLFSTGAVTNMSNMFSGCSSLQSVPLLNTGAVSSSANSASMFASCLSLAIGRTNGIRFTGSYTSCKLSAAEINNIFTGLGTASGAQTITVSGNIGSATCDPSIATAKGWTVTV